uniref:Ig-like domain-containing protein n=1 Tax=Salvator merianae TaxID=96440 RepID=A0A8D0DIV9_SALMN
MCVEVTTCVKERITPRMDASLYRLYSLLLLSVFTGYVCKGQDGLENDTESVTGQHIISEDNTVEATVITGTEPLTSTQTIWRVEASHQKHGVFLHSVPPSQIVVEGQPATLECRFRAPHEAKVIWKRFCTPSCSSSFNVTEGGNWKIVDDIHGGKSKLTFHAAQRNNTGMYYCFVSTPSGLSNQSCGTYFWVRKAPQVSFLNMKESLKNKIITIEGVLLLICSVGPGLFLLFRKRWENERLLQAKKTTYEEENLYEGLNLDECSMYEDISRGLQATYQDIGNIKVIDLQVEKPEKP